MATRLPPFTWKSPASPSVFRMFGLSEGTNSSTVYSNAASKASSGDFRSGSQRRMATMKAMPTIRHNTPGTKMANMFIVLPVAFW